MHAVTASLDILLLSLHLLMHKYAAFDGRCGRRSKAGAVCFGVQGPLHQKRCMGYRDVTEKWQKCSISLMPVNFQRQNAIPFAADGDDTM